MNIVSSISQALGELKFPKCKIFVLNASSDDRLAWEMIAMFRRHGILCWDSQNSLMPGSDRHNEQEKAMYEADFIVAIFSRGSQSAEGRYAKLLKVAFDAQLEKLDGGIKLISILVETCDLPYEYKKYLPLDMSEPDSAEKIIRSFQYEYARRTRLNIKPTKPQAIWL
ncbi:hypothetical protein A3K29_02880 [Candidatus Collierbacteria bacterium RIFOXYB2_FULL_46_14]|uniref:TIR domain-containing protein n=1 Tax=Candidatus Collierbacteria bacterium GW2011_GWA2_46_26 TaxID=1618381 RepID=A0A0G1PMF9_9BACT|nr:MAG: hypothetical protein UW29_C0004G0082 [Candidatus Collierbacteria bacterium GW2011_GWC2_44_13]KKU33867.1 MAG: hypothetical protein UX47_C0001G0150 [Candidatus Collierbacteria bacterium GW2011_GWA2_46_26]OGD73064.1 MAG: hypothetical protein A3K29_02880 [Candidatus Collierbacteria bacterium RIFOXYB2_FULL_46_14]OGD76106.1 MAG: hypothetical protein A3K43_02880 [Candidatus Collierbacteria bacterium RIFOXYA2_FULL_46_20]OGD77442.1 MAG: hypothetical protein A3K39_02880 [Candidatus Collierbacteri